MRGLFSLAKAATMARTLLENPTRPSYLHGQLTFTDTVQAK